jgi:hypothetical protein
VSTENLTQAIGAGATVQFGAGTQFLVAAAAAVITIKAVKLGDSSKNVLFTNVPAGFKYTAADDSPGFDLLQVTSATAQNVTLAVGTDDVSFSNQVTVSGNVSTQDLPATAVAGSTKVTANTAGVGASLVAANLSRRRLTVSWDPATAGNTVIYVRVAGGARLGFLTPGQSLQFNGTYALDYEAAVAGDNLLIAEET